MTQQQKVEMAVGCAFLFGLAYCLGILIYTVVMTGYPVIDK